MIVSISAQAEAELERIADFIARQNPTRALTFVKDLRACCLGLAETPYAFPVVRRYAQFDVRRRVHGSYLLFYRATEDEVTILHVLHAAMDYDAILSAENLG